MKRTDRRSDCPINFALQLFGDSWSLLIIRDLMFKGKHTYAEFADSEEQISTSVLADRLKSLTASGIIRRTGAGRSTRYYLTKKGAELLPVLLDMIVWSGEYDADTGVPAAFVQRAISDRSGLLAEFQTRIMSDHEISQMSIAG